MKQLIFGLVIVALVGGGYLYFSKSYKQNSAPQPSQEMSSVSSVSSSSASSESSTTSATVRTIDVEAGSYYYKPSTIAAKKGETIKIVLHSVSMMHNFNIDELNVHSDIIKNGNTGSVEFTPDKAGVYEYYCSIGKHRALGQVGKLTVE